MDRSRFNQLWNDCLLPGVASNAEAVFDELYAGYGQPHRHYHSREHIEHCLRQFDRVRDRLEQPAAVELAVWFHDLVYVPCSADNENDSAQRFVALAAGRLPEALMASVVQLVVATEHGAAHAEGDTAYLLDIDLSSFGLPWDLFSEDSWRVRQEFARLSDAEFYPGHLAFQQRLLARERLFASDYFYEHYEQRARDNIQRHAQQMKEKGFVPAASRIDDCGASKSS